MFDNKLRTIREERGMSVAELARRSKTSRQTITNIELNGQEPSGRLLISISNVLGRDPRDIFFYNDGTQVQQNGEKTPA
ncbi:helix-turn-helix transcriptional regulator [Paenibacillus sp. FSL R7-0128]|uniref:helix-turn-helix transcriptional regulator n=1 Tax=Paenibacillus sp. FSL R7-0128 TaxID=2954529 RepID=UPI0030FCF96A